VSDVNHQLFHDAVRNAGTKRDGNLLFVARVDASSTGVDQYHVGAAWRGRRKKEEGRRRKKEEGRRKKEEAKQKEKR
jgi:hypothetical protein